MSSTIPPHPGPATILGSDVLHLVRASLDDPPVAVGRLEALLSHSERERAARFHFERDRRRYTVSRGLLRILLGSLVQRKPASLVIEVGAHGKPSLPSGPSFNISHSGARWLCGYARDGRIGVDVEEHRTLHDLDALALDTFHPDEAAAVLAYPSGADRVGAFFRVWSRKESFIKALGLGLAYPLDGFVVSADATPDRELLQVIDPADGGEAWFMRSVGWVGGLEAAVTWNRAKARVEWRGFPLDPA